MKRRDLVKGMGLAAMAPMIGREMAGQAASAGDETVYELRVYHLQEGKQALILERFRTKEDEDLRAAGDAWRRVLGANR